MIVRKLKEHSEVNSYKKLVEFLTIHYKSRIPFSQAYLELTTIEQGL